MCDVPVSGGRNGFVRLAEIVGNTRREEGVPGFYKGLTASYLGISETIVTFVLYEASKTHLDHGAELGQVHEVHDGAGRYLHSRYVELMIAAGSSKLISTTICYPHGILIVHSLQLPSFLFASPILILILTLFEIASLAHSKQQAQKCAAIGSRFSLLDCELFSYYFFP